MTQQMLMKPRKETLFFNASDLAFLVGARKARNDFVDDFLASDAFVSPLLAGVDDWQERANPNRWIEFDGRCRVASALAAQKIRRKTDPNYIAVLPVEISEGHIVPNRSAMYLANTRSTNTIERVREVLELSDAGKSITEISAITGLGAGQIKPILRLNQAPAALSEALLDGDISWTDATKVLNLPLGLQKKAIEKLNEEGHLTSKDVLNLRRDPFILPLLSYNDKWLIDDTKFKIGQIILDLETGNILPEVVDLLREALAKC